MPAFVVPTNIQHRTHLRSLLGWTILSRVAFFVLAAYASSLPLFDASPKLYNLPRWAAPFLRWDAIHFLHIAEHGHLYEHEWAFFPGVPLAMRSFGKYIQLLTGFQKTPSLLLGGATLVIACDSTRTLYDLSLYQLQSHDLAYLASLLSLIPTSPATLQFAPYTEPFFTYLSYKGMLLCTRAEWTLAAICFAIAGVFRSNAILLSGFILWGLSIEPVILHKKFSLTSTAYAFALAVLILSPLAYHNYSAYKAFCLESPARASWCSALIPSIYTYVQSTYWNVGLFKYWTIQQLPNFILAAPPLTLLLTFVFWYLLQSVFPLLINSLVSSKHTRPLLIDEKDLLSVFLGPALIPHVIYAFAMCCILLFASHTQIVLRLGASFPLTYWAVTWLYVHCPRQASIWITYSFLWGITSVILWSTFLPPA